MRKAVFFFCLSTLLFLLSSCNHAGDAALGKRIYEAGILADGSPMQAVSQGNVSLSGEIVSCARCHRKSGFGSFEGTIYVPPITSEVLFNDQVHKREDMIRSLYHEEFTLRHWAKIRNLGQRPAYSSASLLTALEQGINSKGAALDPIMPQYVLDEENKAHLLAYLKTLNAKPAPGIDKEKVHFAAIITEGADSDQETLLKQMIDAYVKWKNQSVAAQLKKAANSPNYKDAFHHTYLQWEVHYWKLSGPEEGWQAQLQAYYQKQPVFAFLSGLSEASWEPIHQFAEEYRVPSLFPNTERPFPKEEAYNLYFSKGIAGEVNSLIAYLSKNNLPFTAIYEERPFSLQLKSFTASHTSVSNTDFNFNFLSLQSFQQLSEEEGQALVQNSPHLLFLISKSSLEKLQMPAFTDVKPTIYLPSSLAKNIGNQFSSFPLIHSYPYILPDEKIARNYRIRAWMRSRGLEVRDEALQMNTYFALSVTDFAISHLVGNYSREYLIERIEHEAENNLSPGIFPSLSLGPGQRFAAKGNYIIQKGDSLQVLDYR